MPYEMDYQRFIADARGKTAQRGLSYSDLGKLTGYSKQSVSSFLCGSEPTHKRAVAIANALDIDLTQYMKF